MIEMINMIKMDLERVVSLTNLDIELFINSKNQASYDEVEVQYNKPCPTIYPENATGYIHISMDHPKSACSFGPVSEPLKE